MQVKKADIEATVEKLRRYSDVDVEFGNTLFTVYADDAKVINEFESRLVAASMDWDGEDFNGVIFLDELVNFTDHRVKLEPLVNGNPLGTWVARYSHLTIEE